MYTVYTRLWVSIRVFPFFPVLFTSLESVCRALNTVCCVWTVFVHCLHQALGFNLFLSFFPVLCTPLLSVCRALNTVACVGTFVRSWVSIRDFQFFPVLFIPLLSVCIVLNNVRYVWTVCVLCLLLAFPFSLFSLHHY